MTFAEDSKTFLTAGAHRTPRGFTVLRWDAATGRLLGECLRLEKAPPEILFSPGGKTLLAAGRNNWIRLYDMATGESVALEHPEGNVFTHGTFSPDERVVLTSHFLPGKSPEGVEIKIPEARLWDAATGQPVGEPLPHRDPIEAVAFHPAGKVFLIA